MEGKVLMKLKYIIYDLLYYKIANQTLCQELVPRRMLTAQSIHNFKN